ncbi:hypothetical protein RJT34_29819 [Clitoria ternatea]|uniref:Uncharacterized protein n=1 Tax=Clitoria ternatea TaxID=43366 RepID=A0AAN9I3H7_CLITE
MPFLSYHYYTQTREVLHGCKPPPRLFSFAGASPPHFTVAPLRWALRNNIVSRAFGSVIASRTTQLPASLRISPSRPSSISFHIILDSFLFTAQSHRSKNSRLFLAVWNPLGGMSFASWHTVSFNSTCK